MKIRNLIKKDGIVNETRASGTKFQQIFWKQQIQAEKFKNARNIQWQPW